jgi:hypothetical protein
MAANVVDLGSREDAKARKKRSKKHNRKRIRFQFSRLRVGQKELKSTLLARAAHAGKPLAESKKQGGGQQRRFSFMPW